jgi:Bacterial sugar transferase
VAQISGRNTLIWSDGFALDVWYIDHASLTLDLKIFLQTVINVLTRKSVSPDADLDVPSFTGSLSADDAKRAPRSAPSGPSEQTLSIDQTVSQTRAHVLVPRATGSSRSSTT